VGISWEELPRQNASKVSTTDGGEYDRMDEMVHDLGEDMKLPPESKDRPTLEVKKSFRRAVA
jgi:hypothetical protein